MVLFSAVTVCETTSFDIKMHCEIKEKFYRHQARLQSSSLSDQTVRVDSFNGTLYEEKIMGKYTFT